MMASQRKFDEDERKYQQELGQEFGSLSQRKK